MTWTLQSGLIALTVDVRQTGGTSNDEATIRKELLAAQPDSLTLRAHLAEHMPRQKWARRTRTGYEWGLKAVPDALLDTPVNAITPLVYEQSIYSIANENQRKKADTLISAALKRAVVLGLAANNAASMVSVPMPPNPEVVPPTEEQVRAILAKANDDWRPFFHVLATTGLRRSEAAGLRWADYNGKALDVRFQLDQGKLTALKTAASRRRVSLDPATVAVIDALPRDGQHIFPQASKPDSASQYFTRTCQRLAKGEANANVERAAQGLPPLPSQDWARLDLHDLRHFHASVLLSRGVSITTVSKRLGHASVRMTLDRYSHLMPGDDESAALLGAL
ncbi:MAG: site-specific integrase [Ilumatobacteraceae bacterium]